MVKSSLKNTEANRIETLLSLHILDTPPEERFDRLTRLAKRLFNVPIAAISFIEKDRQWIKSSIGLNVTEISRVHSFCTQTLKDKNIHIISDTFADPKLSNNPFVTQAPAMRFYAGCPLIVSNGHSVGTIYIIDYKPREFSEDDCHALQDIASIAQKEINTLQIATYDELTNLSNRRGFEALGQQTLNVCKRLGNPASLLFFDLNKFKAINDMYGSAKGDCALGVFSECLRQAFRDCDVIARIGGDKFAVLLTNTSGKRVNYAIKRLMKIVAEANSLQEKYDISFSCGKVDYDPLRHYSVISMLNEADKSMYLNKRTNQKKCA
jgi:diguanylate cyclase (GGDEF)-like protein